MHYFVLSALSALPNVSLVIDKAVFQLLFIYWTTCYRPTTDLELYNKVVVGLLVLPILITLSQHIHQWQTVEKERLSPSFRETPRKDALPT